MEADTSHLFKYFDQKNTIMGTYAACLPLLALNLDSYVNSLLKKFQLIDLANRERFDLFEKINYMGGNKIRRESTNGERYFLHVNPVISEELFGYLEDLRVDRNKSVHIPGFLYDRIMQFTGI
jgi:hypothetical protein